MSDRDPNEDAKRAHDDLKAIAKLKDEAAIKSGGDAVRMVILVNGGAVVAVLAFLGNISGKIPNTQIPSVAASLRWFAWGVAAGLASMFCGYLTNLAHTNLFTSYNHTYEHPYVSDGPNTNRYDWYSAYSIGPPSPSAPLRFSASSTASTTWAAPSRPSNSEFLEVPPLSNKRAKSP